MTHPFARLALAVVAAAALSVPANAQASKPAKHETQAQLKAQAKVSLAAAKTAALAKVPGGHVKSSELERENGKLIYSFDIGKKGSMDITEVHVDAITGAVFSDVETESPKDEKKEAKAEKKP